MSTHRDTRRRLEQWLANTACEANTISAVAGIPMERVAEAEGFDPTMGQSPFALARGQTFERSLLRDDALLLREELERVDVPGARRPGLLDLRLRMNGGPIADQDTARQKTEEWLQAVGNTPEKQASLVASATLKVPGQPILLPDGILAIDCLLLHPPCSDDDQDDEPPTDTRWVLRIGEVKSYPDRGGYTDSSDLATSRAQAGAYHHALGLLLGELGFSDELRIYPYGFLVLTRPGSAAPRIRPREDLRFQSRRAARGFERLRAAAVGVEEFDPAAEDVGIARVAKAQTRYDQSCLSFCDRAAKCRKAAEEAGDPAALGEDTARFLAGIAIPRALELLHGQPPVGEVERDFIERAQEARGAA